jgi:hypothetical protein
MVATSDVLTKPRETVEASKLPSNNASPPPADADAGVWWWDAN